MTVDLAGARPRTAALSFASSPEGNAAVAVDASPPLAWLQATCGAEAVWHGPLAWSAAHGSGLVNACGPGAGTPRPLVPESLCAKESSDD